VTALVIVLGCVVTPEAIASPAFVLSVLATAAVLEPRRAAEDDAHGSLATLRTLLRASVRASLATAPFTLWCFGSLPPLSIVANVVVVPIVAAVLLPLGTVHAMLASVSPELSALTAQPTEHVVRAFLSLSSFFADAGTGLVLPPLDAAELALIGLASFALLRARGLGRTCLVVAVALIALVACEVHLRWREQAREGLRVTFLDVGQGDAALIDLPDGQLWLVDTGGASFGSRRDPGLEAIVPLLAARRRSRVDVAVITHPHPDHYGGFAGVASRVIVGELWDSGQARDEMPDGAWRRGHRGLLVPIRDPETLCDAPHVHGGARVEVIWPCPRFDAGYDANDNSLVLRITYGRRSFLLIASTFGSTAACSISSTTGSNDS
jgi:competence protein ComEC